MGLLVEPLALMQQGIAAEDDTLSLAFAICKPCLLLLPLLLDTRADRRMRPFLRTSGFPGSEVEREMSRAWLVVGSGSVDAARFSR